jgi:hypothetical protein
LAGVCHPTPGSVASITVTLLSIAGKPDMNRSATGHG